MSAGSVETVAPAGISPPFSSPRPGTERFPGWHRVPRVTFFPRLLSGVGKRLAVMGGRDQFSSHLGGSIRARVS